MRRILISVLTSAILLSFATSSFAQRTRKNRDPNAESGARQDQTRPGPGRPGPGRPGPGGPGGPGAPGFRMTEYFDEARSEDGRIETAKLIDVMAAATQKSLSEMDKNGDGLLSSEEFKEAPFFNRPAGPGGPGGPGGMRDFLAEARTKEGKIDLSKLPESIPDRLKTALTEADKNADGFLSKAEQKKLPSLADRRGPEGRRGSEGRRGPDAQDRRRFDNPENGDREERPMRDPFEAARTEDRQIDLSKLPESIPERMTARLTEADKNADGFLSREEQNELFNFNRRGGEPGDGPRTRPGPGGPGGPGGLFAAMENAKTEDGQFNIEKWMDGLREGWEKLFAAMDKDGDGFLSQEEQKGFTPPRRPRSEEGGER